MSNINVGGIKQQRVWFVTLGLLVSCLFALAVLGHWEFVDRLDNIALDTILAHSANQQQANHAVVIDIDDESLAAVGQWPWPRYKVASLIEAVAKAKPAAIGLDILFPEADRTSLINIQGDFQRDFGVALSFTGVPDGLAENDGYLGDVIAQRGVVGAKYFYFDQPTRSAVASGKSTRVSGQTQALDLLSPTGLLVNTFKIESQMNFSGFINMKPDHDGRLRRVPLLMNYQSSIQTSLALTTVMKALGVTDAVVGHDRNGPMLAVGQHIIPLDRHGVAIPRFNGGQEQYQRRSAIDVFKGNFNPEDFAGKVVFIGSSAAGLSDLHATAFDPYFTGLKVQAVMAEDILTDRFVTNPSWAAAANVAECLLVGCLLMALFSRTDGVLVPIAGSIAVLSVPVLVTLALFDSAALYLSPATPLALAASLMILFSFLRFALEHHLAFVRLKSLENARQVTIESMAAVAETRDPETGAHIKRTQHYVRAIARRLQQSGHFRETLTNEYIDMLFLSAPLHDIGKVGVPDHILLKPGPLTPEELVVMCQHAEFGKSIIFSTAKWIEGDNYLTVAGDIAASHHEKWDGSGYPLGLSGNAIPLAGRIMAVADVYDALINRRCYKEPFPHAVASELLRQGRAISFDPVVLDAFFEIEPAILEIAAAYADGSPGSAKEPPLEAQAQHDPSWGPSALA